jgi:uncharacterized Zn finger protein (UPF0148 family)
MGTQLLEQPCPHCSTPFYYRTGEVGDEVTCGWCRRQFTLGVPHVSSPDPDDEMELVLAEEPVRQVADLIQDKASSPALPTKGKSFTRKLLKAGCKAFLVAIASALGARFGGWLGGVIMMTVASAFVVAAGDVHGDGPSDHASS